ncbi:TPA: tetratricopeptide repeat protein [Candidatus Woesearchaeota archaeon]|nr:tetratricopeptide repeat protein [Candidatus Woesearchaeota archaeon]
MKEEICTIGKEMQRIVREYLDQRRGGVVIGEFEGLLEKYTATGEECEGLHINLLFNLACAYEQGGDLEKAVETMGEVVKKDPKDHQAWYNMGTNMAKLARWEEAAIALGQAVQLEPGNPEYRQNLEYAVRRGVTMVRERIRGPIC